MQIETRAAGIDLQRRAKEQLCVPTVIVTGESYRGVKAKKLASRNKDA